MLGWQLPVNLCVVSQCFSIIAAPAESTLPSRWSANVRLVHSAEVVAMFLCQVIRASGNRGKYSPCLNLVLSSTGECRTCDCVATSLRSVQVSAGFSTRVNECKHLGLPVCGCEQHCSR